MTPNNPLKRLLLGATAALVIAVPSAEATISRAISFDDKVQEADAIILGKVVRQQARWDENKRWILTYSTFQVERSIKGQAPTEITVVTPGGEVAGIHQDTIGMPAFAPGDENVIFVKNRMGAATVLFADQGAYEVDTVGSDRIVRPVPTAAVRVDTQRGIAVAPEEPQTLRQFESNVRESIRGSIQRMEIMKQQRQQAAASPSIWSAIAGNKGLIAIALIGAAIATIQLLRR